MFPGAYFFILLLSGTSSTPVKPENLPVPKIELPVRVVLDTIAPPSILWATFVGGNMNDWCAAIVRDKEGNLYLTGETKSTSGLTYNGSDNVMNRYGKSYLAKYSADGNKIWATYFGGTPGRDLAKALVIDAEGNLIMGGLTESHNNDLAHNGFDNQYGGGGGDGFVAKFTPDGILIWSSYLGGSGLESVEAIATDQNGNIYLTGVTESTSGIAFGGADMTFNGYYDAFLTKVSPDGQRLWSTYIGGTLLDKGNSLAVDAAGNVLMAGTTGSQTGIAFNGSDNVLGIPGDATADDAFIMKFDPSGNKIWGAYFGGESVESGTALVLDTDGSIYMTGDTYSESNIAFNAHDLSHNGYYDAYLAKFTSAGVPVWATYLGGEKADQVEAITIDQFGDVYVGGSTGSKTGIANNGFINTSINEGFINGDGFVAAYTSSGSQKWASYYFSGIDALITDDRHGLYLGGITDHEDLPINGEDEILDGAMDAFLTKVDVSGKIRAGYIMGVVYNDSNGNCIQDEQEEPLPGIALTTEPSGFFSRTDSLGRYTISVDTGSYVVKQVLNTLQAKMIEQTCPLPAPTIHVKQYYDTAQYVIGNRVNPCEQLTVQITSLEKIRCFRGLTHVSYQNVGYTTAENVKLYVQLPQHIRLIDSDHSYTSDGQGNLVFTIGTLEPNTSGMIMLTDSVACGDMSILGMTQCTKAWLTPQSICGTPDPAWDKSDIALYGTCVNESIAKLVIFNHGEASMTDSAALRIYADGELAMMLNYKIARNDSLVLRIPAEGKTLHFEADERPGHPFTATEVAVLEGCGTNESGSFSTGFVNSIATGSTATFESTQCQVITGSFDPNDKLVSPIGVTQENYVLPDATLRYTIRFQNKGTSNAVTVIVVDTLDINLDLSTLYNITASHNYTFKLSGSERPVLTWRFAAINLPPEEDEELLSQGFVSFSIRAKRDLADKTVIENEADIFFDFNDPVRTNTTRSVLHDFSEAIVPGALGNEPLILVPPVIEIVYGGEEQHQLVIEGSGFDPEIVNNEVTVNGITGHVDLLASGKLYVSMPEFINSGTLVLTTQAGMDEYTFVITGVESPLSAQLRIYPNPSQGVIRVESVQGEVIREAMVINSQGSVLPARVEHNEKDYRITFAGQPGLYVLKLVTDKGTVYRKIIRK